MSNENNTKTAYAQQVFTFNKVHIKVNSKNSKYILTLNKEKAAKFTYNY